MKSIELTVGADAAVGEPSAEALRLFEEHGASLHRFCRATLAHADDADDVVQETFLKLMHHLEKDRDRSNLRAWLFTVAGNACRDRLRWRLRWLPWREELDTRAVETVDDTPERTARHALRTLRPRDRLLLSLRAQGLSYREIASAAGIREASVGRLLARAIERWKEKYALSE